MFSKLWKRTKEVATMYTGVFVVVMILNQFLFFGFCLNPVCLIAAMPHVLFITVAVGTWMNKKNGWGKDDVAGKTIKKTAKLVSSAVSEINSIQDEHVEKILADHYKAISEINSINREGVEEILVNLDNHSSTQCLNSKSTKVKVPSRISYEQRKSDIDLIESHVLENEYSTYINEKPPSWLDDAPPWTEDEIPPWTKDEISNDYSLGYSSRHDLIKKLKENGVSSIWHMTHRNNIEEILNKGILSNSLAYKRINPIDISNSGVQRWRESEEPIYGRKIHDYVPTYFNIKNPMLYAKKDIQHELCLIEISLFVLSKHDFLYTDGNASSRNTHFYNNVDDLDKLPWDVLNASYWSVFLDGKRKRCSELLIYSVVEPRHIMKFHCFSNETKQYLSQFEVSAEISEELFFGECRSNYHSSQFSSFDDDIPF